MQLRSTWLTGSIKKAAQLMESKWRGSLWSKCIQANRILFRNLGALSQTFHEIDAYPNDTSNLSWSSDLFFPRQYSCSDSPDYQLDVTKLYYILDRVVFFIFVQTVGGRFPWIPRLNL